jgi:hypothetical protein
VSEELPDEIVLKPSRLKWLMVLAIGCGFVAIGTFLLSKGEIAVGLLGIVFFGACALVALWVLVAARNGLRLDRTGFAEVTLSGRVLSQRWEDVSEFAVFNVTPTNAMVVYEPSRVEGGGVKQTLATINRALTGGRAHGISDTYGMSALKLAGLMNAFRTRALDGKPQQ